MIELKNLQSYDPKDHPLSGGIAFLISDDGLDWYESQSLFKNDTWKLEYRSDGTVVAATQDVSALFPAGNSVVEMEELPEGFSVNEDWKVSSGALFKDNGKVATKEIALRASEANEIISVLSSERDAGIISDDDLNRWKAWIVYRKALRELDVTADEIEWPDKPE